MTKPENLPETHPWRQTRIYDRLHFYCTECDISIPVTAHDIQAGIRLFCPSCDEQMVSRYREVPDK